MILFFGYHNPHVISEFEGKVDSMCNGQAIKGYVSLSAAKEACSKDVSCNGIFDVLCDNDMYWTCEGKIEPDLSSSSKSCAWKKGERII